MQGGLSRRDLIDDYGNPGSSVYAPKTRDGGSVIEKEGNQYVVDSPYLKFYQGMSRYVSCH